MMIPAVKIKVISSPPRRPKVRRREATVPSPEERLFKSSLLQRPAAKADKKAPSPPAKKKTQPGKFLSSSSRYNFTL